jgi:plasmid stabilization system protein ParE
MAAKPLEIHPAALAELKSALTWYLERSSTAAANFADELDRVINLTVKFPQRWPKADHGTRKFVLRRFPFAVVYREKQTAVQVLAVAHGHRQPGYWKNRL